MKVFIGLGNPGKNYENTRHNIGFIFIDFLARKFNAEDFKSKHSALVSEFKIEGEKVLLVKPQTFMNNSGTAAQEILSYYKVSPEDVYIAFDDLDIRHGEFKIQKDKYPKVHNGVNDILQRTSGEGFNFIRIGIDNRTPEERKFIAGNEYVLQNTDKLPTEGFETIFTNLKSIF